MALLDLDLDLGVRLGPKRRRLPSYAADEIGEELLSRRQAASTSGLDYVLDTIDKFTGARAVRGALTGKPRELLSILPGSDVLGVTRPEHMTSTEELAKHYNLPTEGAAGLATNIGLGLVTDPSTYLTFGGKSALTAGGKLAQAAGALDDVGDLAKAAGQTKRAYLRGTTVSDLAAASPKMKSKLRRVAKRQGLDFDELLGSKESLSGAMNVGLPFTKGNVLGATANPTGIVGLADRAFDAGSSAVGAAASKLGEKALNILPDSVTEIGRKAGRELKSSFNTAYGNVSSAFAQPRMPELVRSKKAMDMAVRRRGRQLTTDLQDIAEEAGVGKGDELQDWLSLVAEGHNPASVQQFSHLDPELGDEAVKTFDIARRGWNDTNQELERVGFGKTNDATELGLEGERLGEFAPRSTKAGQAAPSLSAAIAGVGRVTRPADISRKDWTKGGLELMDGGRGRYALNKLTEDTDVWDAGRAGYDKIRQGRAMIESYADEAMQEAGRSLVKQGRDEIKKVRTSVGAKYVGLTPERVEALSTERLNIGKQMEALRESIKEQMSAPNGVSQTLDMDQAALETAQTAADWIDHKLTLPSLIVKKLGKELPVQHRGNRMFDDVIGDVMNHEMSSGRKLMTGKWVMEALADAMVPLNPNASTMGTDKFVPMRQALSEARFSTGGQVNNTAVDNLAQKISKRMGLSPENAKEMILSDRLAIPKEISNDFAQVMSVFGGDKAPSGWVQLYDAATKAFKMGVTQYWPAFHVRNRITAAAMNWMFDAGDETRKGVMKYLAPFQDASKFRAGEIVPGLGGHGVFKGLTDEQATRRLGDIAWDNGLTEGAGVGSELGGAAKELRANEGMTRDMFGGPGRSSRSIKDSLGALGEPLAATGIKGKTGEVVGRANQAALEVGNAVEMDNRMATLISLLKRGWDPQAAAARVKELHIDYSDLTAFERGTMRRAIPFYTYTRKMLPFITSELVSNPGGKAAQLAKAGRNMRGDDFLPEHIAGGMAIPWGGQDEEGNQRFLTGLDMPFELLNDVFKPGYTAQDTVEKTFGKVVGMTHPVPKAFAETMLGKQFFSGRDLQTLDGNLSLIGQNLANLPANVVNQLGGNMEQPVPHAPKTPIWMEQLLSGSPLSRAASTLRTATDPRKWNDPLLGLPLPTALVTNLGTGARLSDVNIPREQEMMARQMLTAQLKELPGVGTFEKTYIKPEVVKGLSDEDLETYLLYSHLEKEAQKKGRKKKKAKASAN